MSDNTANSEQDSTTGPSSMLTIEELRASEPEHRLQMLYSVDEASRIALLKQMTARERGELIALEMVRDLNRNVENQTPTS